MFHAHPNFGCRFSRISRELTRSTDREYIAGVVKGGDSAPGTGIRGVPGKANFYFLEEGPPEKEGQDNRQHARREGDGADHDLQGAERKQEVGEDRLNLRTIFPFPNSDFRTGLD